MAQICQKSDNLSHLTGFRVISSVSDLLKFIVFVTAVMLLLDRVHGVLLDLETINGYHMTRYPLRPHLKMLSYAMLPVAVTQPTYNYSVQICYTILPMHWAT